MCTSFPLVKVLWEGSKDIDSLFSLFCHFHGMYQLNICSEKEDIWKMCFRALLEG